MKAAGGSAPESVAALAKNVTEHPSLACRAPRAALCAARRRFARRQPRRAGRARGRGPPGPRQLDPAPVARGGHRRRRRRRRPHAGHVRRGPVGHPRRRLGAAHRGGDLAAARAVTVSLALTAAMRGVLSGDASAPVMPPRTPRTPRSQASSPYLSSAASARRRRRRRRRRGCRGPPPLRSSPAARRGGGGGGGGRAERGRGRRAAIEQHADAPPSGAVAAELAQLAAAGGADDAARRRRSARTGRSRS